MVVEVEAKQSNLGQTYTFTFEDVDYTARSARINIWSNSTLLVDGGACSVSLSGSDTLVSYVVAAAATASVAQYNAEIAFYTGSTFIESSETFRWIVKKSGEGL